MDYKQFNKECNLDEPMDVLKKIQEYLEMEDLFPEQKLYGMERLLDISCLYYIGILKKKIESLQREKPVNEIEERCKKLEEKVKNQAATITSYQRIVEANKKEPAKKKVVVKVHKKAD